MIFSDETIEHCLALVKRLYIVSVRIYLRYTVLIHIERKARRLTFLQQSTFIALIITIVPHIFCKQSFLLFYAVLEPRM